MGNKPPKVSIIFPVRNEGTNVKMTLDSLFTIKTNIELEAVIVDDASTDQCCHFLNHYPYRDKVTYIRTNGVGPANARNMGAARARHPYLAFCDAHMTFENFWIDRLVFHIVKGTSDAVCPAIGSIQDPAVKGYGQSLTPSLKIKWHQKRRSLFETVVLPGACIITSKQVFDDVGGFETGFATWGHEDVELSLKFWLFGYRCHCEPNVTVLHLFRTTHPYTVNYEGIYYNLLRMAYLHFDDKRIKKAKSLVVHGSAATIEKKVLKDGVLRKRGQYIKRRKMDIDDLFKKFNIYF
ncbi:MULTISPECIES: glycosyltransferase [Rossellomorea]|uniref:glycosyltransferase family 2 protein n=1 Tax=Rossellomorea TaxID=2837508 RepID=UPI001CCFD7B5|nr:MULTISPECIES: glycosyltransferase [Rossellomorea]MCA0148540.1 glycosyltransferase [Rossellomorea vietnamensis]WGG47603.1 glycosyltransferase [Rossellomorea sp. DA94]